jgi:hypothetical protein
MHGSFVFSNSEKIAYHKAPKLYPKLSKIARLLKSSQKINIYSCVVENVQNNSKKELKHPLKFPKIMHITQNQCIFLFFCLT